MVYFELEDRKFNVKTTVVENDNNSDKIGFIVPKNINGIDITNPYGNQPINIFVKWVNKNFQGTSDECEITDIKDDKVYFIWTLTNKVTKLRGPIYFSVEISSAAASSDINNYFCWNSEIETFEVKNTIETNDDIEEGNRDYIDRKINEYIEISSEGIKKEIKGYAETLIDNEIRNVLGGSY